MDASGGTSLSAPTQTPLQMTIYRSSPAASIIRPENVLASKPRQSYSCKNSTCCTSNVNPPSRLRGNDGNGKCPRWIPAFAGMTEMGSVRRDDDYFLNPPTIQMDRCRAVLPVPVFRMAILPKF